MSGLLEAVGSLVKAQDYSLRDIHPFEGIYVDLFVKISVEISVLDVNLTYLPILVDGFNL